MKVLIIGGTGFIGYHATRELVRRGHTVTALARNPVNAAELFPPGVQMRAADLNQLSDEALQEIARGHDAAVFAAGVSAEVPFQGPARDFFYAGNAIATARFFRLCRSAGVKRGVLLGSYFSYCDRIWPHLHLTDHHAYIYSRVEQAKEALAASLPDLELNVLELPYIFGAMPGRTPLWAPMIRYIKSPVPLFFTNGGTSIVAVQQVAEAIAGALEQGKPGETYQIGDENVTWADLLGRFVRLLKLNKRVIIVPDGLVRAAMSTLQFSYRLRGIETALNIGSYADVQLAESFFDPEPARRALGYGPGNMEQALIETIRASERR